MHYKNFPNGTHIVTIVDKRIGEGQVKKGSVGVVYQRLTENSYLIKLPDGREFSMYDNEMRPRRDSFRAEHIRTDLTFTDIRPWMVYEFVRGSIAYGLNTPESDEDLTGAFVLPPRFLFGMKKYKDTVHKNPDQSDEEYHEIGKLIQLACAGNPNVIEFGEIIKIPALVKLAPTDELICELFDRWSDIFLSKYVFQAYQGYAISQFKLIERDLRNRETIRWKHACHLLRLLWSGTECMKIGRIILRPKDHSEYIHNRLMEVRSGLCTEEQLRKWRIELEKDFQAAFDSCNLRDKADFEEANKLLIAIREKFYKKDY